MTGQEAIEKLEAFATVPQNKDLNRVRELLQYLGQPQQDLKFIHVGGTNGKGSVSAMLYTIYNRCEYKAGLFTSPHLFSIHERIKLDGVTISNDDFGLYGAEVLAVAEKMVAEGKEHPSQLELSFAIALLYFRAKGAEVVILEVVSGGTYDVTNLVSVPVLTILTNIDLGSHGTGEPEWQAELLEVAGIVKSGTRLVLYQQEQEVMDQISQICSALSVPVTLSRPKSVKKISQTPSSQKFSVEHQLYQISLTGEHQLENVALVLEAVSILKEHGFNVSHKGVFAGLSRTVLPGRFERVHISPDFILDGCHNLQSVQAVLKTLEELYPQQNLIFLLGVLEGEEYPEMLEEILAVGKQFVTVTPNHPQGLEGKKLAQALEAKTSYPVLVAESVASGVETVLELAKTEEVVCALGSLHIVGEIRNVLGLC